MKIDRNKLSPVKDRNTTIMTFNNQLLRDAGFEPGEYVNIMYDKDKITIVKEGVINPNI